MLLAGNATAQSSGLVDEWALGRVYLVSGDSVNGKITYHRNEDLIKVVQPDGAVTAYAAVTVRGFEGVEKDGRYRRVFVTQRWNMGNDYSDFLAPAFFEQIVLGRYSLLRRETMARRDVSRDQMYRGSYNPYGYGSSRGGPYYVDQRADIFFVQLPSGKVKELRNVKKDLETLYGKQKATMKSYVKKQKLKYTSLPDLARIVAYFSSLSAAEKSM